MLRSRIRQIDMPGQVEAEARQIVLLANPVLPGPADDLGRGYVVSLMNGQGTFYWCYWHQFSVYYREVGGYMEYYPGLGEEREKAIALLGGFEYLPNPQPAPCW